MLIDATGRKLKKGQIVHCRVDTIITGQIADIQENVIQLPGQQRSTPYVVIHIAPVQAPMTAVKEQNVGIVSGVYIVHEGDSNEQSRNGNEDSNVKPFESGKPY